MLDPSAGPILLFDGECALCARSVRFVLRHARGADVRPAIRFAPLQGETADAIRLRHPELTAIESVVWVMGDTVLVRSGAAIATLRYMGGPWRALAMVAALIPQTLRDRVYDVVARSRHRLFGTGCVLPTPEERVRFLP